MRKIFRHILRYSGRFLLFVLISVVGFLSVSYVAGQYSTFTPDVMAQSADRLVLKNVLIITDGADASGSLSSVVIEHGRISEIIDARSDLEPPLDALVIDGQGQYLLPGLIDMHAHVFDRSDLALFLAHGVTTTRNMMGYPMHLRWQEESRAPGFPGATMITSSPTLNSGSYIPFHAMVRSPEEARQRVRRFRDEGYSFIKIYDGLNREIYEAVLAEAKTQGLDVAGHVPRSIAFDEILSDGLVSIEHVEELYYYPLDYSKDADEHRALANKMVGNSVAVSTTLTAYYNILAMAREGEEFVSNVPVEWLTPIGHFFGVRAASDYMNETDVEAYERKYRALQSITKELYSAGIPLVLGTDTGPALTVPGYSVHREIERLKEIEIPMADVLAMATSNAALVLRRQETLGTIRKGADADLILVADNPLTNSAALEHPTMVVKGGDVYDLAALEALREIGRDHIGWPATVGQVLEQIFAYGI